MAITDADPALVIKWKSLGKWPLPCQIVFVLKPLTQTQQTEGGTDQDYKHKSRLVICGNFAAWGEHSATTTNLDAPLLRLMLSLACAPDTTWSSIDVTSEFLNADIHQQDTVLVTPPSNLGQDEHCQAQYSLAKAVQHVWKTSQPEHLGPDPDCVPVLRFLGVNLERVDADRSAGLDLPEGSILLYHVEYIIEVLMKFEPSLQLKTWTCKLDNTRQSRILCNKADYFESHRRRTCRIPCITTSSHAIESTRSHRQVHL